MPLSTISPSLVGDNSIADASKQLAGEGIGPKVNWHEYFTYDSKTGALTWKKRPLKHFVNVRGQRIFNTKYAKTLAGTPTDNGYLKIAVAFNGVYKRIRAHRIIWEMCHGPIPEGLHIDHINGVKLDNRLNNLRLATHAENNRNYKPGSCLGASGIRGVRRLGEKWIAWITVNCKHIHLGTFPTKGLAAVARAKASIRYHGKFTRLA